MQEQHVPCTPDTGRHLTAQPPLSTAAASTLSTLHDTGSPEAKKSAIGLFGGLTFSLVFTWFRDSGCVVVAPYMCIIQLRDDGRAPKLLYMVTLWP